MGKIRKTESTLAQTPVYRTFKSRIFEMIFSDRKELLSLYNAVNQTDYKDPEQLEVNTLKKVISVLHIGSVL